MSPDRPPAEAALVLFWGGQDSTVCLAWALERYDWVETVGFDYGQRHSVEMAARDRVRAALIERFPRWAARLGPDHRLDLGKLRRDRDQLWAEAAARLLVGSALEPAIPILGRLSSPDGAVTLMLSDIAEASARSGEARSHSGRGASDRSATTRRRQCRPISS